MHAHVAALCRFSRSGWIARDSSVRLGGETGGSRLTGCNCRGGRDFHREWVPDDPSEGDGLGPMFNDTSCVGCHNLGGSGGGGPGGKNVDVFAVVSFPSEKTEASLADLHPGFRQQSSVVLHRFSTDPTYEMWRTSRLAMLEKPRGNRQRNRPAE